MDVDSFLAGIWRLQGSHELSDAALARKLEISHPYLWRMKHGQRKPGLKTAMAIVRTFPELGIFLSSDLRQGRRTMRTRKDEEVA